MLDFTSTHYLGIQHASHSLLPWKQMTTGVPVALWEAPEGVQVAAKLAGLQGCQQTVLGRSTLHLFLDLIPMLATNPSVIYIDAAGYPIARWITECLTGRERRVRSFQHQKSSDLARLLKEHPRNAQAIIVCDGISVCSGNPSPLPEYLSLLPTDGWLVVDDTQALGILGERPCQKNPYGSGGGGSAHFHALQDPRLVLVCSLAKSFATPLAALSGSKKLIRSFTRESKTRLHCSPPAMPEILAAYRALLINEHHGDQLRKRLVGLVEHLKNRLKSNGLQTDENLFPVQNMKLEGLPAKFVYEQLERAGMRTLLRQTDSLNAQPQLSLVINAKHTFEEIDDLVSAITEIVTTMCPDYLRKVQLTYIIGRRTK